MTTQLPYALTVAGCCFVGYIVAGLSGSNVVLTLSVSFACLVIAIKFLHSYCGRKTAGRSGQRG